MNRVVDKFVAELEAQLADRKVFIELSDGARRWLAECVPRLPATTENYVVFSFGLNDVTIGPIPLNPATDQPFPYELKGGVATLVVPAAVGQPEWQGRKYMIRMEGR